MSDLAYDVVVPTIGRPSLATLLASLAAAEGPPPERVIVVDDRCDASEPLPLGDASALAGRVRVVRGTAAGPAAARNRGWRAASASWIAFLDDDVVVDREWRGALLADLAACTATCAGTQGDVRVPLPLDRRPTDWERNLAALEGARWITADLAYRRSALRAVGGFDERFPRAYREDADLALRLVARGYTIVQGTRRVEHPVRPTDAWVSVRLQAGNADDALMEALHGSDWYERAASPRGALAQHVVTTALAVTSLVTAVAWLIATASFAWRRIAPGPRDAREVRTMLLTSVLIPFAAVYHRLRGAAAVARLQRPDG